MTSNLLISAVIPARDSLQTLPQCIRSLQVQSRTPFEIIVVDDGSREPLAQQYPPDSNVRIVRIPESEGPAAARNLGAAIADGDIVLFVDSDVILNPDTIERITDAFIRQPQIVAVQGVYTPDLPPDRGLFSRYQNHYYHYAFLGISTDHPAVCATFCYAIRRAAFRDSGGFDTSIRKPTVEDEAFGYGLHQAGRIIFLDRDCRVMHLAEYTALSLVRRKFTMSFHQMKHLLRRRKLPMMSKSRTNKTHHPADTVIAIMLAPVLPLALLIEWPFFLLVALSYLAANIRFWRYLLRKESPGSAIAMFGVTWLDQASIFCGLLCGFLHGTLHRHSGDR